MSQLHHIAYLPAELMLVPITAYPFYNTCMPLTREPFCMLGHYTEICQSTLAPCTPINITSVDCTADFALMIQGAKAYICTFVMLHGTQRMLGLAGV